MLLDTPNSPSARSLYLQPTYATGDSQRNGSVNLYVLDLAVLGLQIEADVEKRDTL